MNTICGANCDECVSRESCPGCAATCGRPFGGDCVAAEYIKQNGKEKYDQFKKGTLEELNALLAKNGIPEAEALYELCGAFVDLAYPLPNGESVSFLDKKNIYLVTQIDSGEEGICYGAVAGTSFILVSRYKADGADPELILYKKRS